MESVYDDLESFDLGKEVEKLQSRNKQLEEHIASLEADEQKLMTTIIEMKKIQSNLATNISELYKTAKKELERKDRAIADLRQQVDDLIFKRNNKDNILGKRTREQSTSSTDIDNRKSRKIDEKGSGDKSSGSDFREDRYRRYNDKREFRDDRRRFDDRRNFRDKKNTYNHKNHRNTDSKMLAATSNQIDLDSTIDNLITQVKDDKKYDDSVKNKESQRKDSVKDTKEKNVNASFNEKRLLKQKEAILEKIKMIDLEVDDEKEGKLNSAKKLKTKQRNSIEIVETDNSKENFENIKKTDNKQINSSNYEIVSDGSLSPESSPKKLEKGKDKIWSSSMEVVTVVGLKENPTKNSKTENITDNKINLCSEVAYEGNLNPSKKLDKKIENSSIEVVTVIGLKQNPTKNSKRDSSNTDKKINTSSEIANEGNLNLSKKIETKKGGSVINKDGNSSKEVATAVGLKQNPTKNSKKESSKADKKINLSSEIETKKGNSGKKKDGNSSTKIVTVKEQNPTKNVKEKKIKTDNNHNSSSSNEIVNEEKLNLPKKLEKKNKDGNSSIEIVKGSKENPTKNAKENQTDNKLNNSSSSEIVSEGKINPPKKLEKKNKDGNSSIEIVKGFKENPTKNAKGKQLNTDNKQNNSASNEIVNQEKINPIKKLEKKNKDGNSSIEIADPVKQIDSIKTKENTDNKISSSNNNIPEKEKLNPENLPKKLDNTRRNSVKNKTNPSSNKSEVEENTIDKKSKLEITPKNAERKRKNSIKADDKSNSSDNKNVTEDKNSPIIDNISPILNLDNYTIPKKKTKPTEKPVVKRESKRIKQIEMKAVRRSSRLESKDFLRQLEEEWRAEQETAIICKEEIEKKKIDQEKQDEDQPTEKLKPLQNFEKILNSKEKLTNAEVQLTHDGEIPILHLEESEQGPDSSFLNLIDEMNVSEDAKDDKKANSDETKENNLTFENCLNKTTPEETQIAVKNILPATEEKTDPVPVAAAQTPVNKSLLSSNNPTGTVLKRRPRVVMTVAYD